MFPQPEEVLLSLSSGGKHEGEKEIGPNVELHSSGLWSFGNPFQEFLFVSHISRLLSNLLCCRKFVIFLSLLPKYWGDKCNSHRSLCFRQGPK